MALVSSTVLDYSHHLFWQVRTVVRCLWSSPSLAWVGMGIWTLRTLALTVGPLVWFLALLVRHLGVVTAGFTAAEWARFDAEPFRAPQVLAAYVRQPALITAGYALYALATILLCATVI